VADFQDFLKFSLAENFVMHLVLVGCCLPAEVLWGAGVFDVLDSEGRGDVKCPPIPLL